MLTAALVALALTPAADPADDLARVLAGWERRRAAVKTARYVVKLETPRGDRPPTGGIVAGRWVVLMDFAAGRVRCDSDLTNVPLNRPDRPARIRFVRCSDGQELTEATRLDVNSADSRDDAPMTDVSVGRPSQRAVVVAQLAPLMAAHGWGPAGAAGPLTPGRLVEAGRETVAGRPCLKLRDPTTPAEHTEVWVVDPGYDGAVVRVDSDRPPVFKTPAARLVTRVEYRDTPYGRMPAGWTVTRTPVGGQAVEEERYTVVSAEYNVPITEDEFRFTPPPGASVTTADGGRFVATADGQLVPDLSNRPTLQARFWGSRAGRITVSLIDIGWTLLGGLALVAALTGWLLWHRVRHPARE